MNKLLTAFGLAVLFTMNSAAKVVLPDIISDNMVIQQNTKVRLWGRGNVNTTISVVASWNKKTFTTVSNDKGDWELWIETPCADYTLRQIEISDGEKLVIDNVLVGEVWLCSGQSNMEMPLKGFQNCPVEGGNESIATSGAWKNKIRFVTVPWTEKLIPQESCSGQWKCSLPENAQWFSAVGYYYAQMMNKVLDVPIGIISCSWRPCALRRCTGCGTGPGRISSGLFLLSGRACRPLRSPARRCPRRSARRNRAAHHGNSSSQCGCGSSSPEFSVSRCGAGRPEIRTGKESL